MTWQLHPRCTMEHLGFIPAWLSGDDTASAVERLHRGYSFAGGWQPMRGFKLTDKNHLLYPGDPPLRPIATTKLREETICVYDHSFVAVIQPDRSFEVSRMD